MKNEKPLRIAFDASPLLVNRTGVAYYIERLMLHFAQAHPEIEFVGFYYNFLGRRSTSHFPVAPNLRYQPINFLPAKIVYQLRRWGIEVPLEYLIKGKADFAFFPNFLGYPSLRGTPSAPVIHDMTYIDLPQYVASKNGSDLRNFMPKQVGRSQFVVTVSDFSKGKITEHYGTPDKDIIVTHIPPEEPHLYGSSVQEETLKGLGITKPFILFLGTVEPRKNITSLIDAYAALPPKLRQAYSLVIAGRIGWNCDKEIARFKSAKEEGLDVIHLGYVTEQARAVLFQTTSLFAHASEYEGFGMPILEAMNYQAPCCVSDIPVFREVAADAARYFDPKDISSITSCMEALLGNQAELTHLGSLGKDRAQTFTWDEITDLLYQKIMQTLGKTPTES